MSYRNVNPDPQIARSMFNIMGFMGSQQEWSDGIRWTGAAEPGDLTCQSATAGEKKVATRDPGNLFLNRGLQIPTLVEVGSFSSLAQL